MPRSFNDEDAGRKLYVGNLDTSTTSEELEEIFREFGRLVAVWVARSPPGFAFVTFEDPRDAQDAARKWDGKRRRGKNLRVELARGPRNPDRVPADWKIRDDFRGRPSGRQSPPPQRRRSPSYGISSKNSSDSDSNRGGSRSSRKESPSRRANSSSSEGSRNDSRTKRNLIPPQKARKGSVSSSSSESQSPKRRNNSNRNENVKTDRSRRRSRSFSGGRR